MSIKVKLFKEDTGIGAAWVASCVDFCLSEGGKDPQSALGALRHSLRCARLLEERGYNNVLKPRPQPLDVVDGEVMDRKFQPLGEEETPLIGNERAASLEIALLKVA